MTGGGSLSPNPHPVLALTTFLSLFELQERPKRMLRQMWEVARANRTPRPGREALRAVEVRRAPH